MNHMGSLQQAYKEKKITLYLGAGVSIGNGLPSWERLVLAMYFSVIGEQKMKGWRPLPNYLFAISEWYLSQNNEPLEITVRKLQKYFPNDDYGQQKFLKTMYQTLYSGLLDENNNPYLDLTKGNLRNGNPTLDAVAYLCENSTAVSGIQSVVNYNYDDFLEIALSGGNIPTQSIYNHSPIQENHLPIYHVHGFIPIQKHLSSSNAQEIVFTEDQYNRVATDREHWSNKVQLNTMSNSIGVMIGLSLSDRNMRRLLYASKATCNNLCNYALIKKNKVNISDSALDQIHQKAIVYMRNFQKSAGSDRDFSSSVIGTRRSGLQSGMKMKSAKKKSSRPVAMKSAAPIAMKSAAPLQKSDSEPRYRYEIREIIRQVEKLDFDQQEFIMNELGIQPIWYDNHEEIPEILRQIAQ